MDPIDHLLYFIFLHKIISQNTACFSTLNFQRIRTVTANARVPFTATLPHSVPAYITSHMSTTPEGVSQSNLPLSRVEILDLAPTGAVRTREM